jgi:hypothetical protein
MPARVKISNSAAERIRGVRPSIVPDVQAKLQLLSEKPKLGTPILSGEYEGTTAYQFRVNRLPVTRVFTLLYLYNERADELEVLDFGILDGSPPRLLEPSFKIAEAPAADFDPPNPF